MAYTYRFNYDPILRDGKPVIVLPGDLTETDDAKFEAIAPYAYLTAPYIAALAGLKSAKAVTHRFNILKREPNRWIDIAEPMMDARKYYRNDDLAYSLSSKAKQRLISHEIPINSHGSTGQFVHKLMTEWIRASFDIAIKKKVPAEIVPWHMIQSSPNTPEAIRFPRKKDPAHAIPVTFEYHRDTIKRTVFSDCYPFAIKTGDRYSLIFIEADCDSESINARRGYDIDLKMMQWLAIFDQHLFYERYGFKTAYVIFYSTSQGHLNGIKAHLFELTKDNPRLRKYFLFKRHPSLKSDDKPRATGLCLTEDYERAGLANFNLLTGEAHGRETDQGSLQRDIAA